MRYIAVQAMPSNVAITRNIGDVNKSNAAGRNSRALTGCEATNTASDTEAIRMRFRLRTRVGSRGRSNARKTSSSSNAGRNMM
jgi:hypothetical protein